eukprot:Colp12_sorted_trinity150504_noHs@34321
MFGMNMFPGGTPKGFVSPTEPSSKKAKLYTELLVYEPDVETVLMGEPAFFTRQYHSHLGGCTCYDLEVVAATFGLAKILQEANGQRIIETAFAAKPESIHALVKWIVRTPRIKHDDKWNGDNSDDDWEDPADSEPDYNQHSSKPQTDPTYADLMSKGPFKLLTFICTVPRLIAIAQKASHYKKLLERLTELSERKEKAFKGLAATAKKCLTDLQSQAAVATESASASATTSAPASASTTGTTAAKEGKSEGDKPKKKKTCDQCGNSGATKSCSRCRSVRYCSVECQTAAWKTHKKECAEIKARNEKESA